MSFLTQLIPKQSCVICNHLDNFCICESCQNKLTKYAHRCISCGLKMVSKLNYCGACLTCSPYFNKTYALYEYQDCSELIKKFKFSHKLCIGDFFAYQLYEMYKKIILENGKYDAIIPLPLHKKRIQERGYNQTHELLRIVKANTNANIDIKSTQRIKNTKTLSCLTQTERKKEIKGAFAANITTYKKILLVDDVMTTTASMNELAKTLLKAGAISCDVLVLARA